MPYEFAWVVKDAASYNDYSHKTSNNGKVTAGQYTVLLPDSRIQIVDYKDEGYGYTADVKYEGVAKYDENKPAYKAYTASAYPKPGYPEPVYPAKPAYIAKPAYPSKPAYPEPAYPTKPGYPEPANLKPAYPEPAYPDKPVYPAKPAYPEPAYPVKPAYPEPAYPAKPAYPEPAYPAKPAMYAKPAYPEPDYSKPVYPESIPRKVSYPVPTYPKTTYRKDSYQARTYSDSTYPEPSYTKPAYPEQVYPKSEPSYPAPFYPKLSNATYSTHPNPKRPYGINASQPKPVNSLPPSYKPTQPVYPVYRKSVYRTTEAPAKETEEIGARQQEIPEFVAAEIDKATVETTTVAV